MSHLANGSDNLKYSGVPGQEKARVMPGNEPSSAEKLNWLIHLQHVRGETSACKELIKNEIRKSGGRNEFAYFKQGAIFREEGRIQEALDSFQICMKLNPENADNVKEVARCLYEMRRYRLSLEAYLEAERISRSPDWQIYYNIGQCLLRLGDTSKAKDYAHRAVQLGKHESAYALLIKILTSEGELKSAISVCNAGIEVSPDSVNMLTESGLLHLKMGQTQQAFEKFSSALALDPHCVRALLGIGCITQSHEEHDVALTKYKLAVAQDINSVALWNNIGMCFYSKQKHIAAISCLKRALWISFMNWRVLYNLGMAHLATYQPASAFNFLCAAVNLRPDVPQTFMVLGCALLELRDTENALRALKQAVILNPENPTILLNTALISALAGNLQEAIEHFEKFEALAGDRSSISPEMVILSDRLSYWLQNLGQGENGGTVASPILSPTSDAPANNTTGEGVETPQSEETLITSDELVEDDHDVPGDLGPDEV